MRCGTIGCGETATHVLQYTFPESRDVTETGTVCRPCGDGYMRRSALKAALTAIPVKRSRKRNKLFVWTGVLTDYTSGMIVALAPDVETAISHLVATDRYSDHVIEDMRRNAPEVHEVTAGNVVVEYVGGGG